MSPLPQPNLPTLAAVQDPDIHVYVSSSDPNDKTYPRLIKPENVESFLNNSKLYQKLMLGGLRYRTGDIVFDRQTEHTYIIYEVTVFGIHDSDYTNNTKLSTSTEISYMFFNLSTETFMEVLCDYTHHFCRHVEDHRTRQKRYEQIKKSGEPLLTINVY
jgi:hypothetical protein